MCLTPDVAVVMPSPRGMQNCEVCKRRGSPHMVGELFKGWRIPGSKQEQQSAKKHKVAEERHVFDVFERKAFDVFERKAEA
mmetsp:Transcript_94776/g.159195  ORF Transcript_94776/g.159195 Transcript_94776/m.159195 type:complete len:81 (+) Transcript_94776:157-399(+)